MDIQKLGSLLVMLAIFSVFVMSIIEVVKGISGTGLWGLVTNLWNTLIVNKPLPKDAFPVLNFVISFLCCYKFNVGIMIAFASMLGTKNLDDPGTMFLNYFGTASIIYMGSDQMFKKFINVETQAGTLISSTQTLLKQTETLSKNSAVDLDKKQTE